MSEFHRRMMLSLGTFLVAGNAVFVSSVPAQDNPVPPVPEPASLSELEDSAQPRAGVAFVDSSEPTYEEKTGEYGPGCVATNSTKRGFFGRLFGRDDGCQSWHGSQPPGTSVNAVLAVQQAKGKAARMVLYDYDFFPRSNRLTPRGKHQLSKISRLLTATEYPLIIAIKRGDPSLSQARRQSVIAELSQTGILIAPERIVIGQPPSRGLDGIDAELIHARLLMSSQIAPSGGSGNRSSGNAAAGNTGAGASGSR